MYLSPYSPDLNPIEESFNSIKQWLRRNHALAVQLGPDRDAFLELAIQLSISPDKARAYFRGAGVGGSNTCNNVLYSSLLGNAYKVLEVEAEGSDKGGVG